MSVIRDADSRDRRVLAVLAAMGDDLGQQTATALTEASVGRRRVAVVDGEVLGAAVSVRSEWHPCWDWAHVAVLPQYRRQGLGSALLTDLLAGTRPCKAKVRLGSDGADFAAALDWRPLQVSELWRVAPMMGPLPPAVIVNGDASLVASAFFDFYRRAHMWDPVASDKGPADMWRTHVHDAALTLVVADAGGPEAVALMWGDDERGWEFSGGPCRDGAQAATRMLVDAAAALAGQSPLTLEVDSGMIEVQAAIQGRTLARQDAIAIAGSPSPT